VRCEDAHAFAIDGSVAFASRLFESLPIENTDFAACVVNQAGILQPPCRHGHGFPASSEHIGDEFLGQKKVIRRDPVADQKQPAAQSPFERVKAIARCRDRDLRNQSFRIFQQRTLKRY